MLITNFSSGEISKNLFGRTDLPQYFNAAARLENFDVIPTGGIKRRSGTERLAAAPQGDGRLIPFVIDKNNAYLLYLYPGNIRAYKIENGAISGTQDFTAASDMQVYESLDEIRAVQYAQNFDTMILCHENYPPLEVKLAYNEIRIKKLELSITKTVVAGTGVLPDEVFLKEDEAYKNNGWLFQEGHFPAAVSFFNGRLVFASTKKERQRIFASAVKNSDDNYNFSTDKTFLVEKKEYVVIRGDIDEKRKNIIKITASEGMKFTQALEKYYVDAPNFFPVPDRREDATRIVRLQGDELELTNDATINAITKENVDSINKMFVIANNLNSCLGDGEWVYAREYWVNTAYGDGEMDHNEFGFISMVPGATKLKAIVNMENTGGKKQTHFFDLPFDAVEKWEKDSDFYRQFVIEKISQLRSNNMRVDSNKSIVDRLTNNDNITSIANTLRNNSLNCMKYEVFGTVYYNYPDVIKDIIVGRYALSYNIFIPFYTREIIADSYPTPDCGFTFEIASDMNDSIRWLAVNKGLVIGTETAEWVVPPGVHATNIQAALNSRYGSDSLQGTAIGDATVFFQAGKKRLVEYYIPQADNNFRANDMAMLSSRMLGESPAVEFDFISAPHIKLLVTREDGAVVVLLYERGTGTFAWGRITTDGGKIRSTAVLPGTDGNDDAYFIVERAGNQFIEKLREDGDVFLDSYTPVSQSNWEAVKAEYSAGGQIPKLCRVYEEPNKLTGQTETLYEPQSVDDEPDWAEDGRRFIGYPYTSVLQTMPVLSNDRMKKQRITALLFRFLESWPVKMASIAAGRKIQTDTLTGMKPPYGGIYKQVFPGTWDEEVQAELTTDETAPVKILAINAEMAAGG